MKLWFLNRGYPKWLIDTEVEKVKFMCTLRKRDTKMKGILLVITYHPLLKDFASASCQIQTDENVIGGIHVRQWYLYV